MGFVQPAPRLGNQYRDDRVLRGYLAHGFSAAEHASIAPQIEQVHPSFGVKSDNNMDCIVSTFRSNRVI